MKPINDISLSPLQIQRFWSHVRLAARDECWIWIGASNENGYGKWKPGCGNRRQWFAHRVSFIITKGAIPDGLEVHHKCERPRCVNPLHLYAVTHHTNMLASGTVAAVNLLKTHCPAGHPYDQSNTRLINDAGHRMCRKCGYAAMAACRKRQMAKSPELREHYLAMDRNNKRLQRARKKAAKYASVSL